MQSAQTSFSTKVYVAGEVVMSIIALLGGIALVYLPSATGAHDAGVSLISAIVIFWFSRRQAEQSNTTIATLADGKMSDLQSTMNTLLAQSTPPQTIPAESVTTPSTTTVSSSSTTTTPSSKG